MNFLAISTGTEVVNVRTGERLRAEKDQGESATAWENYPYAWRKFTNLETGGVVLLDDLDGAPVLRLADPGARMSLLALATVFTVPFRTSAKKLLGTTLEPMVALQGRLDKITICRNADMSGWMMTFTVPGMPIQMFRVRDDLFTEDDATPAWVPAKEMHRFTQEHVTFTWTEAMEILGRPDLIEEGQSL